jgi:hypothetical protein
MRRRPGPRTAVFMGSFAGSSGYDEITVRGVSQELRKKSLANDCMFPFCI